MSIEVMIMVDLFGLRRVRSADAAGVPSGVLKPLIGFGNRRTFPVLSSPNQEFPIGSWLFGVALVMLLGGLPCALAEEPLPFPQNRVRNFYAQQAQEQLKSHRPSPKILPQFPGLDGGPFGHWGQNPESENFDHQLNEVDLGGLLAQVINNPGGRTTKAVATILGEGTLTAMFDPEKLTFTELWKGSLVQWEARRYGITSGVRPSGPRLIDLSQAHWELRDRVTTSYHGFYRHGPNVVFSYQIGQARILDHAWHHQGIVIRSLSIEGKIPSRTTLRLLTVGNKRVPLEIGDDLQLARLTKGQQSFTVGLQAPPKRVHLVPDEGALSLQFEPGKHLKTLRIFLAKGEADDARRAIRQEARADHPEPGSLISGGPARWADQTVITAGELGDEPGPYVIDTLRVPYRQQNPFGTPMRLGGLGFLPDGQAAVCTLTGDVWLVDGIDEDLAQLRWKRIAAGLHQPLGLVVRDGKIVVVGRDQLTCLHDLNNDDEADFYECLTNEYPTTAGNSFALTLHQDRHGAFYWFTRSANFGMTKFAKGQKPVSIGTGLRGTNGTGVSPEGDIVLATVQEGSWTPASAIFEVGDGSYHGFFGPRKGIGKYGYQLPLCFIPRGVDNSCGDIVFLPEDDRLGPLAGKIVGTSFGYCQHYLILREKIGAGVQGGVVPLAGEFLSGAHRSRYNPHDGQLYVVGIDGWQSYAQQNGSLQRVRYVGGSLHLPTNIQTRDNGLLVRFNCPIDPETVRTENVFCQQWNYLYSGAYGSAEFSVKQPGRPGHDPVPVKSAHLLADGKTVFLEIPQLHPVMQFHLHMQLKTTSGDRFCPDVYYSIFQLGEPFIDFPGYRKTAKGRSPEFPVVQRYPNDPRLLAQERLGKTLGRVVAVQVKAVPGLQFEPRVLRVPPGRRVALAISNTDPSMPHNLVVTRRERTAAIGEAAMLLAANPQAIAMHYVPDDPGVICLSPILNPGQDYTIYFDSPRQKGAYPFVCTFPGHWKVMRGVLYVADPDEDLPEIPEFSRPARTFVKMWKTADLATQAANLKGRSFQQGATMFQVASCSKCHKIGDQGQKYGPDLTKIQQRFRGAPLLRQILEPSHQINKQYQTYTLLTAAGKTITGLIVKDEPQSVQILTNPLKPEEVIVLPKDEIEEMEPSTVSTMPKGLLMTLTADEILDLLAFLEAGGNPDHPLFRDN